MFDRGGVVAKRLAVQAGPLPVGKTSLKVFDVEGNACPDIGSILLNDVLECTPAPEAPGGCLARIAVSARGELRSEEHTSELQSTMRISYAVFCLQQKKDMIVIYKYTP